MVLAWCGDHGVYLSERWRIPHVMLAQDLRLQLLPTSQETMPRTDCYFGPINSVNKLPRWH